MKSNLRPKTQDPRPYQNPIRILVTGGAGFIGSNLVDALIAENHSVVVVDNLATGSKKNLNKKAKFYEIDITTPSELEKVFEKEKPEVIFHLAAQASVPDSVIKPAFDVRVNVVGTINILELAEKYDVKKIVFSSTGGAIYGDDVTRPTVETANTNPLTPYGIDKQFAETFIRYFATRSNFQFIVLRYANVYGPRQNPHGEAGVIAIFTTRMLKNEALTIHGNGDQTRDYVFVGDIVEANLAALRSPVSGIYNIGKGIEISVNDLAEKLVGITQTKSQIDHGPARPEQLASSLSSEKAFLELGWRSEVDLEEGLKQTVQWYENNLKRKNKN